MAMTAREVSDGMNIVSSFRWRAYHPGVRFPDAVRNEAEIVAIVKAVLGVRWVSLARLLPAAAIRGMQLALQAMREAMLEENVPQRPDLVATLAEIQELMDYKQFFDIERRFLAADQLTRKYGTEQGGS